MADLNFIRKSSETIKSISDFEKMSVSGASFVRIVGENSSFISDISKLDSTLKGDMSDGKCVYKRLSSLQALFSPEDVDFYSECYDNWLRSYKKKAVVKSAFNNKEALTAKLGEACAETLNKYKQAKPNITTAMEKNFVVKLLFWYDSVMGDLSDKAGFKFGAKIVCENTVKIQEYMFFYMLALTDVNVLLLQNKADISVDLKQLELSAVSVLGHIGNSAIPPFVSVFSKGNSTVPQQQNNVRVTIPPRRPTQIGQSPSNNPTPQQQNNVRVTIPPRRSTQIGQSPSNNPTTQQQNNVRVTIPPRRPTQIGQSPNNGSTTIQGGLQMTIPQSNVQTAPTAPNGNYQGGFPTFIQSGRGSQQNIPQQRREKSYEELARLASSIVLIYVFKRRMFSPNSQPDIVAVGSGIMIGSNGYILTNCHVATEGQSYGVRLENDQKIHFTDRLIKYHRNLDLAVLKVDIPLRPLRVYDGANGLARGQKVVAIGSPLGLFNTVSDGIISGFRKIDGVDMIQFTAPISQGSSGGAVLNMYGEVIGISTAGIDDGQNINLAIPYDAISSFCRGFMY